MRGPRGRVLWMFVTLVVILTLKLKSICTWSHRGAGAKGTPPKNKLSWYICIVARSDELFASRGDVVLNWAGGSWPRCSGTMPPVSRFISRHKRRRDTTKGQISCARATWRAQFGGEQAAAPSLSWSCVELFDISGRSRPVVVSVR